MVSNYIPNAKAVYEEQAAQVYACWWPNVSHCLTGSYNNYPMPSLSKNEYAKAYWGDNLERLQAIKRRYDPLHVFQFLQSIPTLLE
jgi:FAD/FMN-containing dehydrogenase